jgi:Fungal N-terminal domain of STAND proteins
MADPLSIGAGVVGIIVPALHGTRLLLGDLRCIVDAPKAIETLKEDLCSVEMALTSLQAVKDVEWELLGNTVVEQSKATINTCTKACDMFRADLQRWTKHSDEGKLSWQDRANVGFFKQHRIRAISDQLQTCRISINSVVGIATLCVALY